MNMRFRQISIIVMIVVTLGFFSAYAQEREVKIFTPKNGEEIFGNVIPYGELWRTGANEATEVKFYKDVQFGNTTVAASTYVLLTVPGEDEWEIILSSKLDVLGAFQYNPIFDVAKITVPVSKAENLESFSIAFKKFEDNVQMVLAWDAVRVKIPLQFDKESVVVKR